MVKLRIQHFAHDNIADGGSFSEDWVADKDFIIEYIFIKRKDGASFTASDITIHINRDPITRDKALISTFGSDPQYALPINEPLDKDWKIEWSGYNREGTTISIVVELIMRERG